MSNVVLSYHAEKRLKERWPHGAYLLAAEEALKLGVIPKPKYQRHFLKLGLSKEGYWTSIYKYYKGFFFIFVLNDKKYILKTVIKWFKIEKKIEEKPKPKLKVVKVTKKLNKRKSCTHSYKVVLESKSTIRYRCENCGSRTSVIKAKPY